MTISTTFQYRLARIFNSHPHKEDDQDRSVTPCIMNLFNSHPHKEDDDFLHLLYPGLLFFNSHPHKEDDYLFVSFFHQSNLFNSHPHKEDDAGYVIHDNSLIFSTHILTRRMTSLSIAFIPASSFQLTSSQGGWLLSYFYSSSCILFFNSHPHKEDDFCLTCNLFVLQFFNSHPHKEDDVNQKIKDFNYFLFNSHPHKEDDVAGSTINSIFVHFQLTSSQGGWRTSDRPLFERRNFQLTSSQGGWQRYHVPFHCFIIFQLTSSQGGWLVLLFIFFIRNIFNSHPHKEDDSGHHCAIIKIVFSTHILTRRMTLMNCLILVNKNFSTHILTRRMTTRLGIWHWYNAFQLTSSQGGWLCYRQQVLSLFYFSTHILTRRMTFEWTFIFRKVAFSTHILTRRMTAILNKNTLSKTARIIPFEYNTLKIYIFSNSYLLFFWKSTPFSGANLPEDFCVLIIRTKISKYP